MTTYQHAAVWIDHAEAKIFKIAPDSFDLTTVQAPDHHIHRHAKQSNASEHPADDQHFYHAVVRGLDGAAEIIVLGPANAKLELMKHVRKHDPSLESKVVGVESSDHPTDGEIVAHARKHFRSADRMRGTAP